jgi:type IV secretory pathway TrbD component
MIIAGDASRSFAILNVTVALVIGMGVHLWWLGFPLALRFKRRPPRINIFVILSFDNNPS